MEKMLEEIKNMLLNNCQVINVEDDNGKRKVQ